MSSSFEPLPCNLGEIDNPSGKIATHPCATGVLRILHFCTEIHTADLGISQCRFGILYKIFEAFENFISALL
jgi:hypothetical protein